MGNGLKAALVELAKSGGNAYCIAVGELTADGR